MISADLFLSHSLSSSSWACFMAAASWRFRSRSMRAISARVASSSFLIFRLRAGPRCRPGSRRMPCAARDFSEIWASGGKAWLQIRAHSARIHFSSRGPRPSSRLRVFCPNTPPGPTARVVIIMWAWGFFGRSQCRAPVVATPYLSLSAAIKSHVRRIFVSSSTSRGRATLSARAVRAFRLVSAASAAVQSSAVSTWLPSANQLPRLPTRWAFALDAWLPYVVSSLRSCIVLQVIYAARWMAD